MFPIGFACPFVGSVAKVGGRLVRPRDVPVLEHPGEGTQPAAVLRLARLGFEVRAELQLGEGDLLSRAEADLLELAEGQIVHVRVEPVVTAAT